MTALSTPEGPKPLPAQGSWTYEDYRQLPEDGWRYEVLEGVLHMTPAPRPIHQEILGNFLDLMRPFVKERRLGKVFFAPTDVLLPGDLGTPVQPDAFFISRENSGFVRESYVKGAPELIVEVLSPSNWMDDRREKYRLYAQAGVTEYWIVDPEPKTVEVFVLRRGSYELLGKYGTGESARSEVLEGFRPPLDEIFV